METTFQQASTKEKTVILAFLKDQNIKGIHLELKPSGAQHMFKKYPNEFQDPMQYALIGTLENVSNDGILHTQRLIHHSFAGATFAKKNVYETTETKFKIPIELIDDITHIRK